MSAERVKSTQPVISRTESSGISSLTLNIEEKLGIGGHHDGRGKKRKLKEIERSESVAEEVSSSQAMPQKPALENELVSLQRRWDKIKAEEGRLKEWDERLSRWELKLVEAEVNHINHTEKLAEETLARLEEEFACSL